MARSISDGEHLSFFNRRYRFSSSGVDVRARRDTDEAVFEKDESCDRYRQLELETPTAPRATPTSDSNDEKGSTDGINELDDLVCDEHALLTNDRGGGEALALLDELGDDGERTAGDGGSTVSGADQGVYEWDDFEVRLLF